MQILDPKQPNNVSNFTKHNYIYVDWKITVLK